MDEKAVAREMYHLMFLFRRQADNPDDHIHEGRTCRHGASLRISHRDMMFLNGIRQLHEGELVKMSELSSSFRITPAAISQVVRHLEHEGLVERVVLESDRRSVYVRITELASEIIGKQVAKINQNMIELLHYLGEEDAEALLRIMRKCVVFVNQKHEQ